MTSVEKVLNVLKERHIAVSRMERDLGFSNGYIRQLKKGTMPIERLVSVADYLDLSINDLLSDGQPHLLEMKEAATPKDDGALLRFALFGDPAEEITDDDIERILDYARYVREKRKGDSELNNHPKSPLQIVLISTSPTTPISHRVRFAAI